MVSYSDPIWITAPLSSAVTARAAPRVRVQARILLACLRRQATWKPSVFSIRDLSLSTGRHASVCSHERRRATPAPP